MISNGKPTACPLNLPAWYDANNPNIISRVCKALNAWPVIDCRFLFKGPVGAGKTELARLILQSVKDTHAAYSEYLAAQKVNTGNYWHDVFANGQLSDAMQLNVKAYRGLTFTAAEKLYQQYLQADNTLPALPTVIDDLSRNMETPAADKFIGRMLCRAYDAYKDGQLHVFVCTTNLSTEEMQRRYGDQVMDRVMEMMTICNFVDGDFRRRQMEVIVG